MVNNKDIEKNNNIKKPELIKKIRFKQKKIIKKMLYGIKHLLPSLEGKEFESATFRIFFLEEELNRTEREEDSMFNLEKKELNDLSEQIYKQNYIRKGFEKMYNLTKDVKIKKLINETQLKTSLLRQVYSVNNRILKEFPTQRNKYNSIKCINEKFSGSIHFKLKKFVIDPIIENCEFLINIDSKNMIKSKIKGKELPIFEIKYDLLISKKEISLIESGFIIKFVNNIEIEFIIKKNDTLLGYYYMKPINLKKFITEQKGIENYISFSFQQICIITFKISFYSINEINRRSGFITNIKRFNHLLGNYTKYSPFRCYVCHEIINVVGYSCLLCPIKCHKICSNFILFSCLNNKLTEIKTSKKLFIKRYNIKHNFIPIKSSNLSNTSLNWCYLCGIHIIYSKNLIECTKCKEYFHKECEKYISNSCGIDLLLRKKICEFKPKSLKNKNEVNLSINNFNLLKLIGRGGFGKILLVEKKEENNNSKILKIISKQKTFETNTLEYLIQERRILEIVSKKYEDERINFIGTMDCFFEDEYNFYFLLKFYPGGDLLRFHKLNKISEFQRKLYCAQILLAISFLHSKNIVYRDLKMENILLELDGNLKLIDFGLSKILDDETTNTFCGTIDTIAPEVINQLEYSCEIDWWSYGCIIYEIFEYKPPFQGDTQCEIKEIILLNELKFYKSSEVVKDLVMKLLNKDKNSRLGNKGFKEIQNHWFFKELNWDKVLKKIYKMDLKPNMNFIENFELNNEKAKVSFIKVDSEFNL